ncbi:glutaredoxin family protein [Colwellia sp. E150_009]|jgi:hypothetical protein
MITAQKEELTMTMYNLYGSEGCHLCEQALAICLRVLPENQLNQIDIVDQERVSHESKTLVELYGVHIPVIEKLNPENPALNQKLFWPFTQEQLTQLTL